MTEGARGRNDPCHCGSGRKYKKCCQDADDAREAQARREREAAVKPPIDLRQGGHHGCTDPSHRH